MLHDQHKYSLTEIDNMIPYERDLYIELINKRIKEQGGMSTRMSDPPTDD